MLVFEKQGDCIKPCLFTIQKKYFLKLFPHLKNQAKLWYKLG